jgi:hypothetical protein
MGADDRIVVKEIETDVFEVTHWQGENYYVLDSRGGLDLKTAVQVAHCWQRVGDDRGEVQHGIRFRFLGDEDWWIEDRGDLVVVRAPKDREASASSMQAEAAEREFHAALIRRNAARNTLAEETACAWLLIVDMGKKVHVLPLSRGVVSTYAAYEATWKLVEDEEEGCACIRYLVSDACDADMSLTEVEAVGDAFIAVLDHRPDEDECNRFSQTYTSLWIGEKLDDLGLEIWNG